MATLRHIAEKAGVSVQTASVVMGGRAVQARISSARAEQIRKIALELGYRPHSAARAMRTRRTNLVGVLVQRAGHEITHPAAVQVIMGINAGLEEAGKVMCLVRASDVARAESGLRARVFRERTLDGMIVVNAVPDEWDAVVGELVPKVVWADHNRFDAVGCVRRDEVRAGRLAAEVLAEKGYRKLLYVGDPAGSHYSERDRHAGVHAAAEERGIDLRVEAPTYSTPLTRPPAWVEALRREPDRAVIAFSAPAARDVALFAGGAGLRCGKDFALACCDESTELWGAGMGISRVWFDRPKMGRRAAQMIVELLRGESPPSEVMREGWVEGETTPALPALLGTAGS